MRRLASVLCGLLLALTLGGCKQGGEHGEAHDENGDNQNTASAPPAAGHEAGEPGAAGGDQPAPDERHEHHNADFPPAEATDITKISMRDFVFVDMPATITGPKLRIEVTNNGPAPHEIVVFDADGNEVGGINPIPRGDSAVLSLELTAGTYEMRCEIAISSTRTHLDEGMKAVFAVM